MDFQVWYNELPFLTKHYMTIAFVTTAMVSFNLINYGRLILIPSLVVYNFEVNSATYIQ